MKKTTQASSKQKGASETALDAARLGEQTEAVVEASRRYDGAGLAGRLSAADSLQRGRVLRGMQRLHGNSYVQRRLQLSARSDAAPIQRDEESEADEDRINQLNIDGVMAFEELADYSSLYGEGSVPAIPSSAPEGLRPALGNLQEAKKYHFELDMPSAKEAVVEQLNQEGPIVGMGKWMLAGEVMVIQESLNRAEKAKVAWQRARPILSAVVRRYAGLNGANATYAASLKAKMTDLDIEMTAAVARRHLELISATTPEYAEIAEAVAEAKEASGVLDQMIEAAEPFVTAGERAEAANKTGVVEEELEHATYLEKALEANGKLKQMIEAYDSPIKIAGAMGEMQHLKPGAEGLLTSEKATFDIAKTLTAQVKNTGGLVINAVADVYTGYGSYLIAANPQDIAIGGNAAMIFKRANDLREFVKGPLKTLNTLSGALGALSGLLGLVLGIMQNDFEKTAGGAIDLGEGITTLALEEGSAAAVGASVGFLQLKGMVYVISEMSRALQAISGGEMRDALKDMEGSLNTAALNAGLFQTAMSEWGDRQISADPVEKELGDQYLKQARGKAAKLHNSLGDVLQKGVALKRFGVLGETFEAPFGGSVLMAASGLDSADLSSPSKMIEHVSYLDDVLETVSEAVGDLAITIEAMAAESKKVKWSQVEHNTLSVETEIDIASDRYSLSYAPGAFDLEPAIDNEGYIEFLAQKMRDRALGQISSLIHVQIECEIADRDRNDVG